MTVLAISEDAAAIVAFATFILAGVAIATADNKFLGILGAIIIIVLGGMITFVLGASPK